MSAAREIWRRARTDSRVRCADFTRQIVVWHARDVWVMVEGVVGCVSPDRLLFLRVWLFGRCIFPDVGSDNLEVLFISYVDEFEFLLMSLIFDHVCSIFCNFIQTIIVMIWKHCQKSLKFWISLAILSILSSLCSRNIRNIFNTWMRIIIYV